MRAMPAADATDPGLFQGPVLLADSRLRRGFATSGVSASASAASCANSLAMTLAPRVSSACKVMWREYSRASTPDPATAARSSTRLPSLPPRRRAVSEYVRGAASSASRRTNSFNGDDVRELSGGSDMFTHSRRLTESPSKTLSRAASQSQGRSIARAQLPLAPCSSCATGCTCCVTSQHHNRQQKRRSCIDKAARPSQCPHVRARQGVGA
jgi:hypothetical protein